MRRQLWLFPFLFLLIYQSSFAQPGAAPLRIVHLQCNGQADPLAIDDLHPRISWRLVSKGTGVLQTAYEVSLMEEQEHGRDRIEIWHTGKVRSDISTGIAYQGLPLKAGRLYHYQVRVWDNQGRVSPWSRWSKFRMGLLSSGDWTASWISPGFLEDSVKRPPPIFTKEIQLSKTVRSATLYITAHGIYEAAINGGRVGNAYFTPSWTSYDRRLQYQVYDVTRQMRKGGNSFQVTVGDGWWRGVFGGDMTHDHYGSDAGLLFQLDVVYSDGQQLRIVSDSSWQCRQGPIRYSDLYNGEVHDANVPNDAAQTAVKVQEGTSLSNLTATNAPSVIKQEQFPALRVFTDPKGEQLIDFGQNISGWVRCMVLGQKGDTVTISHAEAIDKDGNFYTGNLRAAKAKDIYILKGGEIELLEPHFTYHGFRYIRVEGIRGLLRANDFTAIALYSDLPKTGSFECSNKQLNQLQHNIIWSQQDNFFDIPTDCPQRSERYGWTGDAQIFARTASFNRDVSRFFAKWLKDLAADQDSLGGLPVIIPDLYGHRSRGLKRAIAGWGDAATIVPWTLFQAYGDIAALRVQYPAMRAWVETIHRLSPDDFWNGTGYGDWLAPDTTVLTPLPFIAQCYFAHSTDILVHAAGVLGLTDDSIRYSALLERVKAAFLKVYTPLPLTQTAYVLAWSFGLIPDSMRSAAAKQLVALVHSHDDHLSTGFLGTPYLLPVLSSMGETGLAYKVLLQQSLPGWLYPITKGATTIWEKWDAIAPDGTVGEKSLNHYSYGAVGDWLYRQAAGISEAAPGFKRIMIAPHPGGGLTWVNASYECPYGKIVSNWRIEGGKFFLHVEIPVNTEAAVWLPKADKAIKIGSGMYDYTAAVGFGEGTGAD